MQRKKPVGFDATLSTAEINIGLSFVYNERAFRFSVNVVRLSDISVSMSLRNKRKHFWKMPFGASLVTSELTLDLRKTVHLGVRDDLRIMSERGQRIFQT